MPQEEGQLEEPPETRQVPKTRQLEETRMEALIRVAEHSILFHDGLV